MTKYILDTFAWIEYFNGSEKGKKVAGMIEDDNNEVYTPASVVAEIISKFLRSEREIKIALAGVSSLSEVIDITQETGFSAGLIHAQAKKKNKEFGMLDAFVLACARKINGKVITGDDDFRGFKETIFI